MTPSDPDTAANDLLYLSKSTRSAVHALLNAQLFRLRTARDLALGSGERELSEACSDALHEWTEATSTVLRTLSSIRDTVTLPTDDIAEF